jgi:hypothetical protein
MSDRRDSDGAIHETTTEARAGSTPHMTRYVLGIGMVAVIVLFVILFVAG